MIPQLQASEVARRLEGPNPPRLIDVREAWEWAIAHLPGAEHVPLATLPGVIATLPKDVPLVVYCHHGMRSQHACLYLAGQGFADLANLVGGIDAWSAEVDPALPRY